MVTVTLAICHLDYFLLIRSAMKNTRVFVDKRDIIKPQRESSIPSDSTDTKCIHQLKRVYTATLKLAYNIAGWYFSVTRLTGFNWCTNAEK